jgi:hypothetical protein
VTDKCLHSNFLRAVKKKSDFSFMCVLEQCAKTCANVNSCFQHMQLQKNGYQENSINVFQHGKRMVSLKPYVKSSIVIFPPF